MNLPVRAVALALLAIPLTVELGAGIANAQVAVVVGERAMPAPIVEVVPTARPGYAWVPGHWVWRRAAWFWVKGHFVQGVVPPMPVPVVEAAPPRPSPAHVWVKGHYAWEGNHWVWHPGVWIRL